MTRSWRSFPFDMKTMADLYEEATYSREEFFGPYALDTSRDNVEIVTSMHFSYGRCYTLIPLTTTVRPVSFFL